MENTNRTPHPEDLIKSTSEQEPEMIEIQPDPYAEATLIHPDDLELERILKEVRETPELQEPTIAIPPIVPSQTVGPATTPQPEVPQQPIRKSEPMKTKTPPRRRNNRPANKKKKDPFGLIPLVITIVWLGVILLVGLSVGKSLWAACTDVFAFGKDNYTATVTITKDDNIDDIANKLHKANMIRYPKLFSLFARLTDKDENIAKSGTFTLNSQLDYNAMINGMTEHGFGRKTVEIMFPEGSTCAQIFATLEKEKVCTVADIEKCLQDTSNHETLAKYWFLEGIKFGEINCLEGFMFPDTYQFYLNDDPMRVICKFLDAFDYRFTDRMRENFTMMQTRYANTLANRGYSSEYIEQNRLTFHKVVIIASLIEKETAGDDESYNISSVIYNRLTNPGEFPFLNIDAALVYALDGKTELSDADKQLDSPYNTYLYKGLIPGAISNPGTNSIAAALTPNDTNYHYYALNPKTNKHHFTRTYNEHLNFLNSIG